MELALWTYEGPPHIGAMRVATAMEGVHYVLHAPQGDTYADLLFTMIERRDRRPPVTYTTFQARDLGSDTAGLFKDAVRAAAARHAPELMLVGASCTAELLQDDPGGLAATLGLAMPVVPLELPAYSKKENWGAAETFYRIVRTLADPAAVKTQRPSCNILGPAALGFRHRDDLREMRAILDALGIAVNLVAPLGATPADVARAGEAHFNVVLYPEVAGTAATWLAKTFDQGATRTIPIGVGATRDFIVEVAGLAGVDPAPALALGPSNLPWFSRSVDSTYLTGKRVFVFGDATHAIAAARIATEEFGFTLAGIGTYERTFARDVRAAAARYGVEATISDDHLAVEEAIVAAAPELVLGTQMERHIAKRLGIACAVISGPFHVQDAPARHSPQMGFEGANVLWDGWVHPLVMGLEEHLLAMFRDDAEFHDAAGASHLGHTSPSVLGEGDHRVSDGGGAARSDAPPPPASPAVPLPEEGSGRSDWSAEAERELGKIPFFVRGKARRNTEAFARERGAATITLDTLYEAKAHYGR